MNKMDEIIHVSSARDGSIIKFPSLPTKYWLKVCNPNTGVGGIVDLDRGAYYSISEIEKLGIGLYCNQIFRDLNECFDYM